MQAEVFIINRAAWHGARIVLRQTSPESIDVFDFIIELYRSCSGKWNALVQEGYLGQADCDSLIDYAATFLSNIGNYYVRQDHRLRKSHPLICCAGLRRSKVSAICTFYNTGKAVDKDTKAWLPFSKSEFGNSQTTAIRIGLPELYCTKRILSWRWRDHTRRDIADLPLSRRPFYLS